MSRKKVEIVSLIEPRVLNARIPINPQRLSVNLRFKGGHTVPPDTRKAMDQIRDFIADLAERLGFEIGPYDYLRFDYQLGMTSWRSDLDNPIKRTTDAISEALKFNDSRIVDECIHKEVVGEGNEYIDVTVTTIDQSMVSSPIGFKRPNRGALWVSENEFV
jgi:Holliday junction resolvase RusA-like endonuclease